MREETGPGMGKIIRLDAYRHDPHVTISTEEKVHVIPVSYFTALLRGEKVEPLPNDVVKAILLEWLECHGMVVDEG